MNIRSLLTLAVVSHSVHGASALDQSIAKLPADAPARAWVDSLQKITAAKTYDQIRDLYSARMQREAARTAAPPDVLKLSQFAAGLLLGLPREVVDQYVAGDVAMIKSSNAALIKKRATRSKHLAKNLSMYFQRMLREHGRWTIDLAKEVGGDAPGPSAREMFDTLK